MPHHRRRSLIGTTFRLLLIMAVVSTFAFYAGGGWYFSDQLIADAFQVEPSAPSYETEVVEVGEGSITLREGPSEDDELFSDGVYGLDWRSGYGHLGEIEERLGRTVTRTFTMLDGVAPVAGDRVDVEGFAFPGDPLIAHGLDFEEVRYQTPLGPMDAWLVPAEGDLWAIHVHGKGSSRREALRSLPIFHEAGHPSLVIAYRNDSDQPADPSGIYQYGRSEWQDLEGAVRYATDSGAEQVVLVGYSTGAAISLAFLYESELADSVEAAVVEAPNIDLGRTVDYGASQRTLPLVGLPVPQSLANAAKLITGWRTGIDWSYLDYTERAGRLQVPLLVIHGTDDQTVPIEESEAFAAVRPDLVTLVAFEGASHVRAWNADQARYQRVVGEFLAGR